MSTQEDENINKEPNINDIKPIKIPKRVFIVPYRSRIQHKFFFSKYMSFILEDDLDYEIYFSHQCDARTFNRGATKNIGFIAVRNKYPEHYKDITLIFNDVDTIPFNKIFDYNTTHGVVKHFYGFKYTLGGIVAIKGSDFERTNGFPCFWGWGMEDNVLQKRCNAVGLKVDRSVFYNIGSPEILQLFDGISRIISKKDPWRGDNDNGIDGLRTISQLKYTIDEKSENPTDNVFSVDNSKIMYINISTFLTHVPFGSQEYYTYDLREPKRKIINPDKIKETTKTVVSTNDWTNIPYYPTTHERRENVAKYLVSMGKQIPQTLIKQIEEDRKKAASEDAFNQLNNNISSNIGENNGNNITSNNFVQRPPVQYQNFVQPQMRPNISPNIPPNINKYSPQYAAYIGVKPRAQASARVRLGGAY
uniref:Galactosyltransferase C-terminal domain-containing protein n=1 Tax=viral metagenome TaxID=1070528 RepID=A0A6C0AQ71_9ZZZZ